MGIPHGYIHASCTLWLIVISQELYLTTKPYDPEGILGSLTSIVLCLLGVQAGRILTHFRGRHLSIIVRFTIWGIVLVSNQSFTIHLVAKLILLLCDYKCYDYSTVDHKCSPRMHVLLA